MLIVIILGYRQCGILVFFLLYISAFPSVFLNEHANYRG